MSKPVTTTVFLTLAGISSNVNVPSCYDVIFKLRDPTTTTDMYVAFTFNSFDLMFVYLKSLARFFKICSIDNLSKEEYSVKMEYNEVFNAPPTFKHLYIDNVNVWPSEKISGRFLYDYNT